MFLVVEDLRYMLFRLRGQQGCRSDEAVPLPILSINGVGVLFLVCFRVVSYCLCSILLCRACKYNDYDACRVKEWWVSGLRGSVSSDGTEPTMPLMLRRSRLNASAVGYDTDLQLIIEAICNLSQCNMSPYDQIPTEF